MDEEDMDSDDDEQMSHISDVSELSATSQISLIEDCWTNSWETTI